MYKKLLWVWISASFAIAGCQKSFDKPRWEVDILTPLIETKLGFGHIVTDSLLVSDEDHKLKLIYKGSVFKIELDSLARLPDTVIYHSLSLPVFVTVPPGQLIFFNNDKLKFKPGDAELRLVKIREGKLKMHIKGYLPGDVECVYAIPSATKNGQVLTVTQSLPAANQNSFTEVIQQIDISGYWLNLSGNGSETNTINTNLQVRASQYADTVQFNYGDSLVIAITYSDIIPEYAKGYFGAQQHSATLEKTAFGLFSLISSGSISFESIKLMLTITNGFGIDASCIIQELVAFNSRTNQNISLQSGLIGNTININAAKESGIANKPVIPYEWSYNIEPDAAMSFITNLPDSVAYSYGLKINPLGNVSGGNDFVYYGSGIDISLDAELPLSLKANALTLTDTIDFDFSKAEQTRPVTGGRFLLIADNGFPFDAEIQVFLFDQNGDPTTTLFYTNLITHAPINTEGRATETRRSILEIPATPIKLYEIRRSKKAVVKVSFTTKPTDTYIHFYDDYELSIKITGDFSYDLGYDL